MSSTNQNPANALAVVRQRIDVAARAAGRKPDSIKLLAVGKKHPATRLRALYQAGQRDFGENYVDEALEKMEALGDLSICWHFIGPVQSNKTRAIAEHFDWVHSVDRLKIIRRLAEQRPHSKGPLNTLIQVNLDGETQKAGCSPDQLHELASAIQQQPMLKLRGLMAIPAPRPCSEQQRAILERLAHLQAELAQTHGPLDCLSAGMSADLEAAIQAGSTLVRIGTDLFGARP